MSRRADLKKSRIDCLIGKDYFRIDSINIQLIFN